MTEATWKEIAEEARAYRQASLNRFHPITPELETHITKLDNSKFNPSGLPRYICSPEELKITETSPEDLVSALAGKKYSAVSVTKAFLRRAVAAQYAVCVSFLLIEGKADLHRPIALPRFSLSEALIALIIWTAISMTMEGQKGLCTASPLV